MKISKIFAGMSALAMATTMVMSASAAGVAFTIPDDMAAIGRPSNDLYAVFFAGDESEGPVVKDTVKPEEVYGASFTIKVNDTEWNEIGGGGSINFNASSTGWVAHDWAGGSWVDDENPKESLVYTTAEAGTYVVEYIGDAAIFAATDADEESYAAVGINNWAADLTTLEVTGVRVLGEGGSVLYEAGSNLDKGELQKKPVADESSSVADTSSNSTADTSSNASSSSTASSSSSAASSSSKSGSTNNNGTKNNAATSTAAASSTASDNTNAGTGATAGIALAGIALAGAALVVAKKK